MFYRVAIYTRVSTLEQAEKGYSLGEQEDQLLAYCKAKSWSVYKSYCDDGYSGANLNRPAMQELLQDAKKKQFDIVVVSKLDRLSRSQKDVLYLIEDVFNKNEIAFTSVKETLDTSTAFGKAMIGILAVFAQLEREQIRDRMQSGKIGRAKSGKAMSWVVDPFGYKVIDGQYQIVPLEAKIVKEMFDIYLKRPSVTNLVKVLNDEGHIGKKTRWSYRTVKVILTNPIYCGYNQYGGNKYKGNHEPIISVEDFDYTQSLIEKQKTKASNPRPFQSKYMLSGLIRCGYCGSPMGIVLYKPKKDGTRTRKYQCLGRKKDNGLRKEFIKHNPSCPKKTVLADEVENYVLKELQKIKLEYNKNNDKKPDDNVDLYKKEIDKIQGQRSRLIDLYVEGLINSDDFKKRDHSMMKEEKALNNKIKLIGDQKIQDDKQKDAFMKMSDNIFTLSTDKKKDICNLLIEKVEVKNDEIAIRWRL